jgi:peroxiredoxin
LTQHYSEIMGQNAEVVAISVDDLAHAQQMASSSGVDFPILYNPDKDVVQAYGVFNLTCDGLATPSTFIVDASGVIRYKFVGSTTHRTPIEELLRQLAALSG